MANYRNISISFWTDSKIDDEFTPEDKYFYLYLLTNPHTNICGCYEISMKQMERETGYNIDTVKRLLKRMQNEHRVILYSEETKEVLILHWCRYNWTDSDKVKKAVLNVSQHIKNSEFKQSVNNTVLIGYPYTMVTSVSDTDTDTVTESDTETGTVSVSETVSETENRYSNSLSMRTSAQKEENPQKEKSEKFKPPTVDEVKAYCKERNNGIDAEAFVMFYESKGWKIGKNKMKNWKAAVITWEKNRKEKAGAAYDTNISGQDFDFSDRNWTNV